MGEVLTPYYDWLRALHIISVIFWMAGMFMLPRYFAYHSEVSPGSPEDRAWMARERRLLRIIINPSMIAAWLFGLGLLSIIGVNGAWFHAKLTLVIGLTVLHHLLSRWRKHFERGENKHDSRFYRLINEIPTLATIAIVILVVVKPF